MVDNVRILEELVVEAVDRLQCLTKERDGLSEEIDGLREHLDALKREASHSGRGSEAERSWRSQTKNRNNDCALRNSYYACNDCNDYRHESDNFSSIH